MSERATLTAPAAAKAVVEARAPVVPGLTVVEIPPPPPPSPLHGTRLRLDGKALKVVIGIDTAALARIDTVPAKPIEFEIMVGGRKVRGTVKPRAITRALAIIAKHGPQNCVAFVQGRLEARDILEEAGLVAQPKGQKPAGAA